MPQEYLRTRGIFRGLEFSEHIAEHKNPFFRDRGIFGGRRLRVWVEEQKERVNEIIHLMDKSKVRSFLDLLATAKVNDRARFLDRLKRLILDDRSRGLNRSERLIEIMAGYGLSDNGLTEFIAEALIANGSVGPAVHDAYNNVFDLLTYYKGSFRGDEAVYPLVMVRGIFANPGDPETKRKICRKYFELLFSSSNPRHCLKNGKNFFSIILKLMSEKKYDLAESILRRVKDLKTYIDLTSKITAETLEKDFKKIVDYLVSTYEFKS